MILAMITIEMHWYLTGNKGWGISEKWVEIKLQVNGACNGNVKAN